MKLTIEFEWRKKDDPEHWAPEVIVAQALQQAGYTTGPSFVQGDHFEDKAEIAFSELERLPHEEIAK